MWQKRLSLVICAVAWAGAAFAAPVGMPVVLQKKVIPLHTVYAWERWGNFINAVPGDGKDIPYDAARLTVRVFTLPSGEIRVIDFAGGVRTHPHFNMTDTILYTWTGSRVQFADGKAAVTVPGDAALHPKGVYHHGEALQTGKGIEFVAFVAARLPDPQVTWKPAASLPMMPMAAWMEGRGTYRELAGDAVGTAPAGAARFEARTFDFPPYVTREYRVAKGTVLPLDSRANQLVYVTAGRARVSTEGVSDEVATEDAAHVRAGVPFTVEALEDLVLLTSSIPPGTPRPPAFR
jgi:quercetin dioxygenase-like cupin family protein